MLSVLSHRHHSHCSPSLFIGALVTGIFTTRCQEVNLWHVWIRITNKGLFKPKKTMRTSCHPMSPHFLWGFHSICQGAQLGLEFPWWLRICLGKSVGNQLTWKVMAKIIDFYGRIPSTVDRSAVSLLCSTGPNASLDQIKCMSIRFHSGNEANWATKIDKKQRT